MERMYPEGWGGRGAALLKLTIGYALPLTLSFTGFLRLAGHVGERRNPPHFYNFGFALRI